MALFIDFHPLSPAATDDALEHIYKATHDHDQGIWSLHESILIRRLIELFSQRGLDRLASVQKSIQEWNSGQKHNPATPRPSTVPGMMSRWTQPEMALVRLYLESLPPAQWTLDDHMMSVDLVVQQYLPESEMHPEAEWLATRATMMGQVQANMAKQATIAQADAILTALPLTVSAAIEQFHPVPQQATMLKYGAARAVENVRSITETVRHKMRNVVMQDAEEKMLKLPGTPGSSLETKLADEFATLNRDWRRIAVTEAGECQLQGFISSLPAGAKVKRIEQYANACSFCKKIDGIVCEVVSPDAEKKDPTTQVWVGKTNIGRSASPRKRVGDKLVPRAEHEMWQIPAGTVHPHCRGRWVLTSKPTEGDDPAFADWLNDLLA